MSQDRWLVVSVRVADERDRDELIDTLMEVGGTAVEEDVDLLTTYIAPPEDVDAFMADAYRRARATARHGEIEMIWRWQDAEDWAEKWKRGLRPRRIGKRLVIAPSWTTPEAGPDDIVLVIDPEMAFGTGEHASTRGALRLTEQAVRPGVRVLDVGSGSAILAIAAARLGAVEVIAVEADPDALENATDNIVRNHAADSVRFEIGLVDEPYLRQLGAGRLDVILGNVLSGVLKPLLAGFRDALAPGGQLVLAGIMEHEADEMIDAAADAGFTLAEEDLEDEWWAARFEKR